MGGLLAHTDNGELHSSLPPNLSPLKNGLRVIGESLGYYSMTDYLIINGSAETIC